MLHTQFCTKTFSMLMEKLSTPQLLLDRQPLLKLLITDLRLSSLHSFFKNIWNYLYTQKNGTKVRLIQMSFDDLYDVEQNENRSNEIATRGKQRTTWTSSNEYFACNWVSPAKWLTTCTVHSKLLIRCSSLFCCYIERSAEVTFLYVFRFFNFKCFLYEAYSIH